MENTNHLAKPFLTLSSEGSRFSLGLRACVVKRAHGALQKRPWAYLYHLDSDG
jgi:hypothetical protein